MRAISATAAEAGEDNGDLILWILVWSELAAFGALLAGFLVTSVMQADSFGVARFHLDTRLASLNTVVLLLSSWQAARAARPGASTSQQRRALLITAALGFVFVAVKFVEYKSALHFAGDATFNAFFELYFMITGFHLAHVVFLGAILLLIARRPERSNIAIVTTLWHVVDVVWLVMFPLIYLV